jgi:hypothetical protein
MDFFIFNRKRRVIIPINHILLPGVKLFVDKMKLNTILLWLLVFRIEKFLFRFFLRDYSLKV